MKQKMLSIGPSDLVWQTFRAGGKGGQNQNKRETGVRVIHPPSGAVGEARDERHQRQNRKNALARLATSPKFRIWVAEKHTEIVRGETIEAEVEKLMDPANIRVEVRQDGKWVPEGD